MTASATDRADGASATSPVGITAGEVEKSVPTFNMIDLFSGVGGITLGFSDVADSPGAVFVPRLMVDSDREARDVARRNMPAVPFIAKDISKLSAAEVRQAAGLGEKEPIHLLVGGPPCQGFSKLGRRALDDERNALLLEFLRMVKELRPLVAVMENVPMVVTSHDGAIIREVSESLSGMGYSNIADILNASDFGVPQQRRRAFVIAYRGDLDLLPRFPERSHERVPTALELMDVSERVRFEPDKSPYVSVEEAIGDLPPLKAAEGDDVMLYTSPARTAYQRWAREGSIALFNHRARPHSPEFLKKISVIEEGGRNAELPDEHRFSDNYFSQAYARLHRHGIAQTITTFFTNPGSGRFTHYRDSRAITVREAARLQSFQDRFIFDGTVAAQMRQIGNAVPPLLARAIRTVIGEDLVALGAHLEAKPIGRPKRPARPETPEQRSRVMRSVPSKNSRPELQLRKALVAAGVRGYRLHRTELPGSPDVVFTKRKVAIFVDGCFWHGCPKCYRAPKTNSDFWTKKVTRNQKRDAQVSAELSAMGYSVERFWEHQVVDETANVVRRVRELVTEVPSPKERRRRSC